MLSKIKMALCVCVCCVLIIAPIFSSGGEVVSVLGKAEVQTENGWEPLKAGDTINSGTVISTGFRSQVVLQVGESTITVQALSRLTLEQLLEKEDGYDSEVYLDIGSIRANVASADNKRVGFIVNTPVATASVRGTELIVDTNSISVISGAIVVTTNSRTAKSDTSTDEPVAPQKEIRVSRGSSVATNAASISRPSSIVSPQQTNLQNAVAANPMASVPSTAETSGSTAVSSPSTSSAESVGVPTGSNSASIIVSVEMP